jgi:TadE-like protein
MLLNRLHKDVKGAAMVEFAVIAFLFFVLLGALFDFTHMFWQRNMLIKAVERGARVAAVSNPVAGGAGGLTAFRAPNNCQPGDPYPAGAFDCVCSGASATCTAGPNGPCGLAYDAAAMNTILTGRAGGACGLLAKTTYTLGMCDLYPGLTAANVVVEYSDTGLGFCGRPGGPVPTITVYIGNPPGAPAGAQRVPLRYFFLAGLLNLPNLNFSSARATITGEDLSFAWPPPP